MNLKSNALSAASLMAITELELSIDKAGHFPGMFDLGTTIFFVYCIDIGNL